MTARPPRAGRATKETRSDGHRRKRRRGKDGRRGAGGRWGQRACQQPVQHKHPASSRPALRHPSLEAGVTSDDELLLAQLTALVDEIDPIPQSVIAAARASFRTPRAWFSSNRLPFDRDLGPARLD
jgi:hypothetical protein